MSLRRRISGSLLSIRRSACILPYMSSAAVLSIHFRTHGKDYVPVPTDADMKALGIKERMCALRHSNWQCINALIDSCVA